MVTSVLGLLRSLLDGPVGPRHRKALLELCLIMPARWAPSPAMFSWSRVRGVDVLEAMW
jgi:hypothetical protein